MDSRIRANGNDIGLSQFLSAVPEFSNHVGVVVGDSAKE